MLLTLHGKCASGCEVSTCIYRLNYYVNLNVNVLNLKP